LRETFPDQIFDILRLHRHGRLLRHVQKYVGWILRRRKAGTRSLPAGGMRTEGL
jgi:hypothetical protein